MSEANKVKPISFKDQIINLPTVLRTLTLLGEPIKKIFLYSTIQRCLLGRKPSHCYLHHLEKSNHFQASTFWLASKYIKTILQGLPGC